MALLAGDKDWDRHVIPAELVARSPGFQALRDEILARAAIAPGERVVDLGAGTGLLTLPAAETASDVWAIDISPSMCEYLSAKARSAGLENVNPFAGSIVSLPLVDGSVDVAISNYCFHHLRDGDKLIALRELRRALAPGGRVVIGDMMFRLRGGGARGRAVARDKARAMARKGPAGIWRLAKNGVRLLSGRWEHPADADWWRDALTQSGFDQVGVRLLEHEGGVAWAKRT